MNAMILRVDFFEIATNLDENHFFVVKFQIKKENKMKYQESPFYGIFEQFINEIQTLCNIQGITLMLHRSKLLFYSKFFCCLL